LFLCANQANGAEAIPGPLLRSNQRHFECHCQEAEAL
jgi:hypothetical protein